MMMVITSKLGAHRSPYHSLSYSISIYYLNGIDGVMIGVLISGTVDRTFEP